MCWEMNKGSDKPGVGRGPVDYVEESAYCLFNGEADGTQASDTHRVLGRGPRRYREEELPPQCVGGPWEPRPCRGPVGLRAAGGVQWQADVGSGAPDTFWCTVRSQLSLVLQAPTLRLAAVRWDPCEERKGVTGPDLRGVPVRMSTTTWGPAMKYSGLYHHSPPLPNTGPADSRENPHPGKPYPICPWDPSTSGLGGHHSVHLEARDQSNGQETSRHDNAEATQAPQLSPPGQDPTCSSHGPVHLQPHLGRPAELLGSKLGSGEKGFTA